MNNPKPTQRSNTQTPQHRLRALLLAGVVALGTFAAMPRITSAAIPPLPEAKRVEAADLVATGEVLDVKSIRRPQQKDYVDEIYTITIRVDDLDKGQVANRVVQVTCWRPAQRPGGWAGPQGQNTVPAKGQKVRFYATKDAAGRSFRLLEPNGIDVVPATQPATQPGAATQPTPRAALDDGDGVSRPSTQPAAAADPNDPYDVLTAKLVGKLDEMVAVLKTVDTDDAADAAAERVQAIGAELKELKAQTASLPHPGPEVATRLRDKYQPRLTAAMTDLTAEAVRVTQVGPEAAKASEAVRAAMASLN